MLELDLETIKKRLQGISPAPWYDDTDGETGDLMVYTPSAGHKEYYFGNLEGSCGECHANARFVANARQDIPALIAEVGRLRELNGVAERWNGAKIMLDTLRDRSLIGPSDHYDMDEELFGKGSLYETNIFDKLNSDKSVV